MADAEDTPPLIGGVRGLSSGPPRRRQRPQDPRGDRDGVPRDARNPPRVMREDEAGRTALGQPAEAAG